MMKHLMPVVARQDLAEIRAELGPWVRAFLADNADGIRDLFAEEFGRVYPEFTSDYNYVRQWPEDQPVELWDVEFDFAAPGGTWTYTVGGLLDQMVRPVAEGERIRQSVFEVNQADSRGLDRPGGRVLPLVVLEVRTLGQVKYDPAKHDDLVNDQQLMQIIGAMTGMARRGAAAAEVARGLPRSLEGQLVAAWLRQAAAVPERAERDRAALMLRQAAGWYLGEFRDDAEALKMTLGLFGRPGELDAVSLPGAQPEPPEQWAAVAGRYETAYEAVRVEARGVALPSVAVRALVGELAELAGGGGGVGYRPEVLDSHVVLALLSGIGQSLRGRGGAELMVAVNDLLMAASLGLAAREDLPGAGLVSPDRVADVLREISEALSGGRDPWAATALAGAGYRADEPLVVRLTRLVLQSASPEGRLVVAWLRQAVAAPEGAAA